MGLSTVVSCHIIQLNVGGVTNEIERVSFVAGSIASAASGACGNDVSWRLSNGVL